MGPSVAISSQVTGILNSVSLGFFYFKIAFTLRDAKLLNEILTMQKSGAQLDPEMLMFWKVFT